MDEERVAEGGAVEIYESPEVTDEGKLAELTGTASTCFTFQPAVTS